MISWFNLISSVLENPAHVDISIPQNWVPHPTQEGFRWRPAEWRGQIPFRDYEIVLEDGKSIHVSEFQHEYKVHWDYISPSVDPIEHLRLDAPFWYAILISIVENMAAINESYNK